MSKIVSTKKSNAVFIAVILVAGTITLFLPSFLTEANAQAGLTTMITKIMSKSSTKQHQYH